MLFHGVQVFAPGLLRAILLENAFACIKMTRKYLHGPIFTLKFVQTFVSTMTAQLAFLAGPFLRGDGAQV